MITGTLDLHWSMYDTDNSNKLDRNESFRLAQAISEEVGMELNEGTYDALFQTYGADGNITKENLIELLKRAIGA